MKKKLYTAIGLMSGTSMDGVDLSIISSDGHDQFTNILDDYYKYDYKLQDQLINLRNLISTKEDLSINYTKLSELERNLTIFHAEIINQTLQKYKNPIDLIGFHGQTIFHNPELKITKQLGDGHLLSQLVRKNVVYDFRQADIANDGQGAPLTPIFHYLLANKIIEKFELEPPISFLNIGGISNVTQITGLSNAIEDNILAVDIGPGNCLIDEWIRNNSKLNLELFLIHLSIKQFPGPISNANKLSSITFDKPVICVTFEIPPIFKKLIGSSRSYFSTILLANK